jgi:hypothetical protein
MLPPRMGAPKMSPAVMRQRQEDQIYTKKIYFLKRTIKALVFVSRTWGRGDLVVEERGVMRRGLETESEDLHRVRGEKVSVWG